MAKGYWIVQVDVKNEEAVKRYEASLQSVSSRRSL